MPLSTRVDETKRERWKSIESLIEEEREVMSDEWRRGKGEWLFHSLYCLCPPLSLDQQGGERAERTINASLTGEELVYVTCAGLEISLRDHSLWYKRSKRSNGMETWNTQHDCKERETWSICGRIGFHIKNDQNSNHFRRVYVAKWIGV